MPRTKKTPDVPIDRLDEMLVRLKLSRSATNSTACLTKPPARTCRRAKRCRCCASARSRARIIGASRWR